MVEVGRKGQLGKLDGSSDNGGAGAPFEGRLVVYALAASVLVLTSETVLKDETGAENIAVGESDSKVKYAL